MVRPLLLFDCDGTLVDSEPLLAAEMAAALTAVGLPFQPADYLLRFRGVRFRHIVRRLEAEYGPVPVDRLTHTEATMRARLAQRLTDELAPIAGAKSALAALFAYPRAVVSNGAEPKIRTALAATGLDVYFPASLFSGYAVNCWKPDPCLHLHAARSMGYAPEDCIAIDDALVGVEAALAAGMRVIHLNRFPGTETTPENAIMIRHMNELAGTVARLARARCPTAQAAGKPPPSDAATGEH